MQKATISTYNSKIVVARIPPGKDLIRELSRIKEKNSIKCAGIVTLLGSLTQCRLRRVYNPDLMRIVHDKKTGERIKGVEVYDVISKESKCEIVASEGTISDNGMHVHLVLSGPQGEIYAGHLLEGNIVFTTVEVFLIELPEIHSQRLLNHRTGHKEIVFTSKRQE